MGKSRTVGVSITPAARAAIKDLQVIATGAFQRPINMSEALVITVAQIRELPTGVWQAAADKVNQEE